MTIEGEDAMSVCTLDAVKLEELHSHHIRHGSSDSNLKNTEGEGGQIPRFSGYTGNRLVHVAPFQDQNMY